MATNWEPNAPYTAFWRQFQHDHPCAAFVGEVILTAALGAASFAALCLLLWALATNGNE